MRLIDTSVIIEYLRGNIDLPDDYIFTTISFYELFWKALEKNAKREMKVILGLFSLSPVLDFDIKSAKEASRIKMRLRKIGKDVNDFDILIAGICLANGVEEIWTKDKDFKEIEKISDIKVVIF